MSKIDNFLILHERVKKSSPNVAEVLCRKYLALTPNDLRAWMLLLDTLIFTKNYKEALILISALLKSNFCDHFGLTICVRYLLLAGDYTFAKKLFSKIDFEKASHYSSVKHDLYHLAIIKKLETNEDTAALEYESLNLDASEFNKKSLDLNKNRSVQVICFIQKNYHYMIQAQIAKELLEKGINVLFSNSLWFIKAVRPEVLIVSEALYKNLSDLREINSELLIVNTRHGLGDKNHAALGASQSDKICVSSESIAKIMINETLTPKNKIWVTGYPQMDDLFRSLRFDSPKVNVNGAKIVIFAPTFNPHLSAAYLLKNDLVKSIRGSNENIKIIVKPHPHLFSHEPEIISNWIDESHKYDNVFIDTNPNSNIMDYFIKCDLMISDVSSAALAWFSVNKPLVCLIDRRNAQNSENFSDDGLEWKMHQAATVINNVPELANVVNHLLINPEIGQEDREKFSKLLFGELTDGRGSYRVAVNIINFITRGNND